jgi:nucleotide-binding universal stress UspA family protein
VVETADTLQADLIVMGSHGRSGLERLVLGSVTQAVLSHTKVTVLVVRA